MQEEQNFLSLEDLQANFERLQRICNQYEDTCKEEGQTYVQTLDGFQTIQNSIIHHGLFSPNEELKEIKTEHLYYLLLPYYVGDVFGRISGEQRFFHLQKSQLYLTEFLKLMEHYEQLSNSQRNQWKVIKEKETIQNPSREEKISSFKEKKEVENKLANLLKIKEESEQREVVLQKFQLAIFSALDQIFSIRKEFIILEYQEKLKTDKDTQQQFQKENNKPIPQMKVWTIPKPAYQELPMLLQSEQGKPQNHHDVMCDTCVNQSLLEYKYQKKSEVFRPGISMPTMTLDQFVDQVEMPAMLQNTEQSKKAAQEQKKEEEESSEDEEVDDRRKQKARYWDDWKDAHEKGSGNTKGR